MQSGETQARAATRISESAEALFVTPHRFFLPYLALYLVAWLVDLPVGVLVRLFEALHLMNLALLGVFAYRRRGDFQLRESLFWGGLLLFFLVPGAYLEYPADAWHHLQRIYEWQHLETVAEHDSATWKFAYFWGYSLMHRIPVFERRIALDLYSAFWQMLVAIQIHSLARRLGSDGIFAKLQVVGFFALFGLGPKGMRFFALSSTPLAYFAFLGVLVSCLDVLDGRDRRAWRAIPGLCALALANHRQEVIFILMGTASLLLVAWFQHLSAAGQRRAAKAGLLLVVACFASGALAWALVPEIYPAVFHWQLTPLGSFRLWQRWYFMDTYGIHGVVSLLFALALLRSNPRLALLTWTPTLVLLLPPSVLILTRVFHDYGGSPAVNVERLILGFPTSFALVHGLRTLWGGTLLHPGAPEARRRAWIGASIAILALALPASFPWNGRLYLQVHRPHADLQLRFLDETLEWFATHREIPPSCRILSDGATQFGLLAQLGFPSRVIGMKPAKPRRLAAKLRTRDSLLETIHSQPICAVMVAIRGEVPPVRASFVSQLYRAWDHRFASPGWLTSDGFRAAAEGLVQLGWQRTRVPPWYLLYEPPRRKRE